MKSYKSLLIFGLFLLSNLDALSVQAKYLCPGLDARLVWESSGANSCIGTPIPTDAIPLPNESCLTSGTNGSLDLNGVTQGCTTQFSCGNGAVTTATTSELFIYSGIGLGPGSWNTGDGKGLQGCCGVGSYEAYPTWDATANTGVGACVAPIGTIAASVSSCIIPDLSRFLCGIYVPFQTGL